MPQVLYRFANIDLLCFNTLSRYFGCASARGRPPTPARTPERASDHAVRGRLMDVLDGYYAGKMECVTSGSALCFD